ncbi:MAG TPA: helix-turn-helix domain-containing protein [Kribbellaceae bacterium]|nr:helix-turn-helix domain-containing protein [Kribbellaceae bacterium]
MSEFLEIEQAPRKLRADAARNRARLLDVAYEAFAAEGLAVPIDEIARRAGVGAGTVYRHFPTKESLFLAIVANRIAQLADHARALTAERDPGEALFAFLATLVAQGATDQGLVEALAGVGFDLADAAPDAEQRFMATLGALLDRAQQAGAVRPDVDLHDLKTLLVGCQAMQRYNSDPDSTGRLLAIIRDGLETRPT